MTILPRSFLTASRPCSLSFLEHLHCHTKKLTLTGNCWLIKRVLLGSHSDVHCLTLNEVMAIVSCTVVSPSMALSDNKDLQLWSLGTLTFPPQTLLHVFSVPGECGFPCAFSHREDKDQHLSFSCLAPMGLGLQEHSRHRDSCVNTGCQVRAWCRGWYHLLSIMAGGVNGIKCLGRGVFLVGREHAKRY